MSKYEKAVFDVLSDKKIKSTNEIVKEVERNTGRSVNWHMIYRVLLELSHEGKAEKLEAKVGFFWKRKKDYYIAAESKEEYKKK
ncbi:Uncharacterised protein [uncultured archaeon]|nr:Uncharacterised protein [uncultured archaeon]